MAELLAGGGRRAPVHVIAMLAGSALLAAAPGAPATAQPRLGNQPLVAFEAARVDPSHSPSKRLEVERHTGNFIANNASLAELIAFAYGVRTDQVIDLPAWAAGPRYDVEGRAPTELAGRDVKVLVEDVRPLVAGLLVDYFSLEAHRSQSPIYYVLEPAAGGVLLRASTDQRAAPGSLAQSAAGMAGQRVRIGSLVTALESLLERPVLNQSVLYGLYDVDFRWDPRQHDSEQLAAELERQLGLTLRVVQFELVVVDRATELEGGAN
jgi:uncharacterized protein (TIGR03435 family)